MIYLPPAVLGGGGGGGGAALVYGSIGYDGESIIGYNPSGGVAGWYTMDDLYPDAGPAGGITFTQTGLYMTAPSAGVYLIQMDMSIRFAGSSAKGESRFIKNGSVVVKEHEIALPTTTGYYDSSMAHILALAENDTIALQGLWDTTNQWVTASSNFMAIRLGDTP